MKIHNTIHLNMRKFLIYSIIITILAGCSAGTTIQVLKPADITLPGEITKFTLVNRTKPNKKNQVWNVVEGILTGEGVFADREGADQCLSGLMQIMQGNVRYNITQASVEFKGSGTEEFAPPLTWPEVETLCRQNSSEALIVLESFDSDSRVTMSTREVKVKNAEGVEVPTIEHIATGRMEVKTGWRIYFPGDKRIVDLHRGFDYLTFEGRGVNPEMAMRQLPNKRDCIRRTGFHAGQQYGYRISPQWINVYRKFFTRGNDNMKLAGKKVKHINDWKNAMEIWKKEALNTDTKIAWHACYNMAVGCEREGNLQAALEWANKAYNIGHKGDAAQLVNALNYRIAEQRRLDEQMKGVK